MLVLGGCIQRDELTCCMTCVSTYLLRTERMFQYNDNLKVQIG